MLALSKQAEDLHARLLAFMDEHVYPAEPVYEKQHEEAEDRWAWPPIMEELKAKDIVKIDVREHTSVTDYMIIASGTSNRQVKALADNVVEKAKDAGLRER